MYLSISQEVRDGYTLFIPTDLDSSEFRDLPSRVADILLDSKRDIVLSLVHIDTVLSSHLSVFVQLYQLLQARKQRFVIVDACEAIADILEMTQLTTLLTIFPTVQAYEASAPPRDRQDTQAKLDFSWKVAETDEDKLMVECVGYVVHGAKMQELRKVIAKAHEVVFDLSQAGYMDTQTLLWLGEFAGSHRVSVKGANPSIKELFLQNGLQGKVIYED
jgi:anti-anti-sigma factor